MPTSLISSCFKLNYKSSSKGYYDISLPKYKHPFYVKSIESKTNLNLLIFLIINNDLEINLIAESFNILLFEKFRSKILIFSRFSI
jgi:hypothetical protein